MGDQFSKFLLEWVVLIRIRRGIEGLLARPAVGPDLSFGAPFDWFSVGLKEAVLEILVAGEIALELLVDRGQHWSEPSKAEVFELDLLVLKKLMESGFLGVKLGFELIDEVFFVIMVHIIELLINKPDFAIGLDELLDCWELMSDSSEVRNEGFQAFVGIIALVAVSGGSDELDQEDLHQNARDDQDLDVGEVLAVDELLEQKVLKPRIWAEPILIWEHMLFDLVREGAEEIVDVSQRVFYGLALLPVCFAF